MNNFNYEKVYELARNFAKKYSNEIIVEEGTRESVLKDGIEYPCVPLKFIARGNKRLYDKLLESGFCTKMDGKTENGSRIIRVLLWVEQDCINLHKVNN